MATPKPERRPTYGDDVYASFDEYKTINQIALDNEVIQEKKTSNPTDVTLESSGRKPSQETNSFSISFKHSVKDNSMQRADFKDFWRCWITL